MDSAYEPHWSNYLSQFENAPILHIPDKSVKVAVIVEPRKHELLPLVVRNFMYLLKGWRCIIIHGTENGDFIRSKLSDVLNIHYVSVNVANLTLTDYNNLMCSPEFWTFLRDNGYQYALSFEVDTLLLSGDIDRFLTYDYVGAPWYLKWLGHLEVGNSGLCIRNVSKMLDITRTCPRNGLHNNDIYFAFWCNKKGLCVPTPEIAGQFSAETVWHGVPCGFHKPHLDKFPRGVFEQALAVRHIQR